MKEKLMTQILFVCVIAVFIFEIYFWFQMYPIGASTPIRQGPPQPTTSVLNG